VLYVYEPEIIAEATTDPSHLRFIDECLAELDGALRARGGAITYRHGAMPDVLAALDDECAGFDAIYAHEETGSAVGYARDRCVRAWCKARGIAFEEIPQFGVVRRLSSRDGWAKRWDRRMSEPLVAPPAKAVVRSASSAFPTFSSPRRSAAANRSRRRSSHRSSPIAA
jgi:deoxyribodipyrimidine photo-lyase